MKNQEAIFNLELVAYAGEDQFGTGHVGLKQGMTRAGVIPLVAILDHQQRLMAQVDEDMAKMAKDYGKAVYLVKLKVVEIIKVHQ